MKHMKYKGLGIVIGTATLLFGSIVYAGTGQNTTETASMETETAGENQADDFAAGVGRSIGEEQIEEELQESGDREDLQESTELTEKLQEAEPATNQENEDIKLEAGVATIFSTETQTEEAVAAAMAVGETAETEVVEEEDNTHWGYMNLGIAHVDNHLNIRETAAEDGKLVGKLPKNAACEILEIDDNGWAHIKSGKVEGYCSIDYLYMGEEAIAKGEEVASMMGKVNTQTLKVREEPNTDSVVITLIPQDEELEVVEVMSNGWIKFMLDDEEAYVSGEFVDVEERLDVAVTMTELQFGQGVSDVRVSLVQFAKQFVGNPYVWGGTSLTKGADCSGFTMSVFAKFGVSLPHHAASQAGYGTKISLSEAKPGDLVFYAKNGSINHVGIYIGGGQVLHASSPKTGIKISSVSYRTPAQIRRILP